MGADDQVFITPGIERRQYRRVQLVAQVQCAATARADIMVTRDISIGGMFINAKFPLPMDSEVNLTFRLRPTDPAITCRAKVMYSRVGTGMGIQFLDLSEAATASIQKFVDEAN